MSNNNSKSITFLEAQEYLEKVLLTVVPDIELKDISQLVSQFSEEKVAKNTIVINEGDISEYFYFIFKGLIRVYYYKNNKKVIERFEKEGSFFGGNFTHITKQPGTHIYETIENSILLKLKYKDLEKLCSENHAIERLYRVSMEIFHLNYANTIYSFKSLTSEEKYKEFIRLYGDLSNRVSLKNIANFLDMTSETLSRIRSK